MSPQSHVISTYDLKAGERIGYGGVFRAESPIRSGVVA